MATIAKVVTQTKTEAVVESLARFVTEAKLQVSDRLPAERDLAIALGVSRPVLREALKRLEALGVIEPRPGSGTFLRTTLSPNHTHLVVQVDLERESLIQLLELRRALESEAAAMAAARAPDEAIANLGGLVDQLEDEFRRTGDNPESDKAFHMALYVLAENRLFWDVITPVWEQLETFWQYPLGKRDFAKRTLPLHRELYERIRARDPEGARKVVHRMFEIVEEDLRA
ncbi:MAG TPA: FadR/GntR family transcriptional regulator [Trueperaceae bacterium]|nr:FadR/GntR family transcriptional regulator [Trueperaceae bacterium]